MGFADFDFQSFQRREYRLNELVVSGRKGKVLTIERGRAGR